MDNSKYRKVLFRQENKETDLTNEYRQKLKNLFPEFLCSDVEKVLAIMPLAEPIYSDPYEQRYKVKNGIHGK